VLSAAVIAGGPARPALAHLLADDPPTEQLELLPYPYAAVRWDGARVTIHLDALGAWPLYLRRLAGGLAIGTAALPLARLAPVSDLDPEGVVELLSLGQLLGQRTLFRQIEALPAGARYTIDADSIRRRRWREEDAPASGRTLKAAADQILAALDETVAGAGSASEEQAGVLLSGGVDSRLVLALLARHGYPVRAFTFGQPGCADERYASRVTAALGVPHRIAAWTAAGLERVLEHAVALTDGHVAATHFHGMDLLDELRQATSSQWNGFAGDAILGGSFAHPRYGVPGPPSLASRLFASLNQILRPDELRRVIDPGAAAELSAHPRRALLEALAATPPGPPSERARHLLLDQRVGRLAAPGLALDRHYLPVRTPYAEGPVLAVMRQLRLWERRYGRALCQVLVRHFPELATIPWQRTGARPGTPWPVAAAMRAGWRLWARLGRGRGPALADYVSWLDGPLGTLRRQLLTSPSLRSRSLFSASGLAALAEGPVRDARESALAGVLMAMAVATEMLDGRRGAVGELPEPQEQTPARGPTR
jgi:asparagine synthase (glutamine-hydrolysing)